MEAGVWLEQYPADSYPFQTEMIWCLLLENGIQILEWKLSHWNWLIKRCPFPFSGFYVLNHLQGNETRMSSEIFQYRPKRLFSKKEIVVVFWFSNKWLCRLLLDSQPPVQPCWWVLKCPPEPAVKAVELLVPISNPVLFWLCPLLWPATG